MQRVSQSDGAAQRGLQRRSTRCRRARSRTTRTSSRGCARCPAYVDQTIELMREQLAAGLRAAGDRRRSDARSGRRRRASRAAARVAAARRVPTVPRRDRRCRSGAAARPRRTRRTTSSSCRAGRRLETFLRDTYRKQARPQIGVELACQTARAAYAALIHAYTTTRMSGRADSSARPAGSGAHREGDGATGARGRLHGSGHRVRAPAGRAAGDAVHLAGGDDAVRARRAGARAAAAAASVQARAEDGGRMSGRFPPTARRRPRRTTRRARPTARVRPGST